MTIAQPNLADSTVAAPESDTALIALDWGTSALRAWRVSTTGAILDHRREPWGIMHLPEGGFTGAFAAITRGWSNGTMPTPAIACGMVGSRQGWREVPYLPTPAGSAQLAAGLLAIEAADDGRRLHLVPGLLDTNDPQAPDVMRGEETQAIGAIPLLGADCLLVMPGTHCKWSRLRSNQLVSFRTMMTGEVFAVLRQHSILGRGLDTAPLSDPAERDDAFVRGVRASVQHGAFARLFSTRALTLTGSLPPGCAADYLSGLLIGEELRLETAAIKDARRLAVTGDAALCGRYARAFAVAGLLSPGLLNRGLLNPGLLNPGLPEIEIIADTALAGLLHIAAAAKIAPDLRLPSAPEEAA